jgi:hypothetical protein
MVKEVKEKDPKKPIEILATNFWWNKVVQPCKEGFPRERAVDLFVNGWKSVSNIWDASDGKFASIEEVKRKFSISTEEERIYAKSGIQTRGKMG